MIITRESHKGLFPAIGGIIVLIVVVAVISFVFLNRSSGGRPPTSPEDGRLQRLRSDPMYNIRYPNVAELRRVEHDRQGFKDPPTVVYYAGTNDADQDIVRFFITEASSHGWVIFNGPGQQFTDEKVSVTFVKEGVGSLFVRLYDPERLNRSFRYEKLPVNGYSTILWVTLRMVSPPTP